MVSYNVFHDTPFSNLDNGIIHEETDNNIFQQFIYELIINHKTFSHEMENINLNFEQMLSRRYQKLKVFIYIYLNINLVIIIIQ